jgi:hypothetical protein
LAEQLNSLSLKERQQVLEEIHGVLSAVEETPQLVQEAISQMRKELYHRRQAFLEQQQRKYHNHNENQSENEVANSDLCAECYIRALQMEEEMTNKQPSPIDGHRYLSLNDKYFLLKFLRAERFDAVKAAARFLNFLVEKEKLFGTEKLLKIIQISDLDDLTKIGLKSGYFQILPGRDVAGRAIIIGIRKLSPFQAQDDNNFLQMIYYLSMLVVDDVTTQRNGVVCIGYSIGSSTRLGRETLRKLGMVVDGLPMRVGSYHYCLESSAMRTIANALAMLMGNNTSVRYRFHSGTHLEIIYQMMTFGIPHRFFPFSANGEVDVTRHQAFIEERERDEAAKSAQINSHRDSDGTCTIPVETSQVFIIVPGPRDVLLGRGRLIQENMGNIRYRNLIETYRTKYNNSRKKEKTRLTVEIIQNVHDAGGRFLKQVNGDGKTTAWVEVSTEVAREKVSHSFRDKRRID